ncbi:bifunctional ADP-dependent NAD(P)H-hydrate dehydratase/NAD(P)H-hydrate epimerase [Clostridium polynesiense]|uniref:bifunctional ADP-dependent NAD(P)H-hydrate dehydratase/NAD(P)H-hydrate epimerase n=1 Tax=Clostridium polynesiense TaxID=1325933 RepID=UPI0005904793|nr:bifunctional ADP-dependent NAD(P)H-hydrate dehydratase/NAD(P)H-hydrate epimerase [Clostridium polynesiense]
MKIGRSEVLRKIDKYCIENLNIPGIVLMENAALKVMKHLNIEENNKFSVVCGSGNNGGDGFAVARHLKALDKSVEVFLIGNSSRLSKDCRINYDILRNMGLKIKEISNVEDFTELKDSLQQSDIVVDAVFGTGLTRELEEPYLSVISIMNENSRYILSVDIPSGMESDSGEIKGNAIKADKTVTFELYKKGFINYKSHKHTGNIAVEDIGIPGKVIDMYHEGEFITSLEDIKKVIPKRDKVSHKGNFGRVVIIAGSEGYTGAAYITTEAAVSSGAGLVTLCCPKNIQSVMSAKVIEAMTFGFKRSEDLIERISSANAAAVGPGMGSNDETLEVVKEVLSHSTGTVVLDADALNVLEGNTELLKGRKASVIITPHPGEMSRLTGLSIDYINENRIKTAKEFAEKNSVVVILKGYNTVITDGISTYINPTGTSAMASGGMGDCLTGIIAALAVQGLSPLESAYTAAYIHGAAGDKLSCLKYSVSAHNIIEELPYTLKEMENL